MRKIKYFSVIEKKWIDVEVSDEVAKFLAASDMQMKRKQRQYDRYTVSLNQPINCDGENLTLEDTIAEPKPDKMDRDKRQAFKIIRKYILELPKDEKEIIGWIYYRNLKQKEVAKLFNTTESSISQRKQTIIDNLLFKISQDKEFQETRFAKKYLYQMKTGIQEEVNETSKKKVFSVDLLEVKEYLAEMRQINKKLTTLGADINTEEKDVFSKASRLVNSYIDKLLEGKGPNEHCLNIPLDYLLDKYNQSDNNINNSNSNDNNINDNNNFNNNNIISPIEQ